MDDTCLDDLVRTLREGATRRRAAWLLGGLGLGLGELLPLAAAPIAAKKGKKRRKKKVAICHNGQTMTVPKRKLKRHRGHGDTVGACPTPSPPPPPTCAALGQPCAMRPGTPCCPDIDPNVVCSAFAFTTCQDCRQAPTAAGVFCQNPPGNQCCGGDWNCNVGVRVEDGSLVCVGFGGLCLSPPPCTHDFAAEGCPVDERCCFANRPVCVQVAPDSPCCSDPTITTLCAPLCPSG